MPDKITNSVFLILLFLLQSCSGGKIGNFLESSFKNNNTNKISQNDINKKLKSDIISNEEKFLNKKGSITKIKTNGEVRPLNKTKEIAIRKNDSILIMEKDKNYKPKSYRVFVILKKVDPSFPTENFSKVLRNGDINFEIEKIELIPELNQNKK